METAEWGDGVVDQLAANIARTQPGLGGFTRPNLFCIRLFYAAYQGDKKVSPLVRQLSYEPDSYFDSPSAFTLTQNHLDLSDKSVC
jgi:hypothetical protein